METPPAPSAAPRALSPQDEHIMAALAHVSAIIPMLGIIAPIVIWVTQREKSEYVAFQALQAIAYQLAFILLWFAGFACYFGTFFVGIFGSIVIGGIFQSAGIPPFADGLFFLPFAVILLLMVLMFVMIIYGVVAAVLTFQGKDFRYILIGRYVERYTQRTAMP